MILPKRLQGKLTDIVLDLVDKTIGKKFPIIDKATDLFESQDSKIRDLELRLDALEHFLKDNK